MNKYFKNNNPITIQNILKLYQNKNWGTYPQYTSNCKEAQNLIQKCQQSDQYKNWKIQCQEINSKVEELKNDIREVEGCRNEIVLKNSLQEYEDVVRRLKVELRDMEGVLRERRGKQPKSKKQLLKGLYQSMEKGKKLADADLHQRDIERKNKCHCDGFYCQC